MSEELPIVIVLSVMPGWFLKPSHEPALTPGTAAAAAPFGLPPVDPVPPDVVPAAVPVPPAPPVEAPEGASTVAAPGSPVPASPVAPVVSEPLPEPRLPDTARL